MAFSFGWEQFVCVIGIVVFKKFYDICEPKIFFEWLTIDKAALDVLWTEHDDPVDRSIQQESQVCYGIGSVQNLKLASDVDDPSKFLELLCTSEIQTSIWNG